MKLLIGIPIIMLAVLAVVLLAVLFFVLRMVLKVRKYMRGDFTDEEVERLSKKYHRDGGYHFERDYFKRSERNYAQGNSAGNGTAQQQQRATQTAEGVTIIDGRNSAQSSRKIFGDDEGEYVEFEEEK